MLGNNNNNRIWGVNEMKLAIKEFMERSVGLRENSAVTLSASYTITLVGGDKWLCYVWVSWIIHSKALIH